MAFINHGNEYQNTADFVRRNQPLVMEIEAHGETRFVNGMTPESCRRRAEAIYGDFKEIIITTQREALNV